MSKKYIKNNNNNNNNNYNAAYHISDIGSVVQGHVPVNKEHPLPSLSV